MAFRLITGNFPLRGLFKAIPKVNNTITGSVRRSSVFVEPPVPWLEKPSVVFSGRALRHHWGALPVVIFTVVGFTLEVLAVLRLAATRDDTYYTKTSAACEFVETQPGAEVPRRKFMIINQKYENPPGLVKAMLGDTEGPPSEPFDFHFVDLEALKIWRITIQNVNKHKILIPGDKRDNEEVEKSSSKSSTLNKKVLAAHGVAAIGVIGLLAL